MQTSDSSHDLKLLGERVEFLETKVSFQDDTIEQLNQTVIKLDKELSALKSDLILLVDKLRDNDNSSSDPSQVEIPPHY